MNILVATHGMLASGLESASRIIVGESKNLYTYTAYVHEDKNEEQEIRALLKKLSADDQLIILTDILGGSVNTIVMREAFNNQNIYIVSGVNLGLLLQLLLFPKKHITSTELETMVAEAKQGMIILEKEEFDDEEF